jgi:hypothetical protein
MLLELEARDFPPLDGEGDTDAILLDQALVASASAVDRSPGWSLIRLIAPNTVRVRGRECSEIYAKATLAVLMR